MSFCNQMAAAIDGARDRVARIRPEGSIFNTLGDSVNFANLSIINGLAYPCTNVAEDVTVVHPRLGQRLKLKRPVLIRGGDAGVSEPASHRAETSVRNVW